MNKILLVQTGFLGDVVLSTPVIRQLKLFYPEAKLSVMTTPLGAPLVKYHPDVSQTVPYDKRMSQSGFRGLWEMAKFLRKENYDAVFSLHKSWRTAALLFLARIPKRYGFKEAHGRFLYSKTAGRSDLHHDVLRNLAIFRVVNREPLTLNQELLINVPEEVDREVGKLFRQISGKPYVVIAPGSVWLTKRWTEEGFAEVIKTLKNKGYEIVLIGSHSEENLAEKIIRISGVNVLNLVGRSDLLMSAAIIRNAELAIVNDSSPLHLASAMKTPVVAIFCATVPEFGFGPWKVLSETVGVSGLACRPCGRHGGMTCPTGTHACRIGLSAEVVVEACLRVLEKKAEIEKSKLAEASI